MVRAGDVLALLVPAALAAAVDAQQPLRWLATEHLGVLTPPPLLARHGLSGTDLGVSFAFGERLVFLFGDSWTLDRADQDVDSAATCALALPARGVPALRWLERAGGRFAPLTVPGLAFAGMDVPVEGVAVGARAYVFFSSGWSKKAGRHSHSVCAHTTGGSLEALAVDHRVATERFVNVSVVVDGGTAWVFGTGAYRKSPVFLARVAAAELGDRAAWRYWPDFAAAEKDAKPLIASDCLGELSVRRLGDGTWAMTANAAAPRGIHLRTATAPTGPWSDPVVIFDPARDRGYGLTMHQSNRAVGFDDGLSDRGRTDEWGGEYGPYLVPAWCTQPAPGVHELVYTLSTWNPYSVRLLRSTVAAPDAKWTPPAPKPAAASPAVPPRNLAFRDGKTTGWDAMGDAFALGQHRDGSWFVCTYVEPRGDAVAGRLAQEFVVPNGANELRGIVWGGDEALQLWRGDELVRCTRGARSNAREVPFRWRLDDLRGQRVRLVIADESAAPWGFVSVRGLELVE